MAPLIKIHGNKTPDFNDDNLCGHCKNAVIVKGVKYGQEKHYCMKIGEVISFNVNECTSYQDHNTPSLWEMQKIAWKVVTDKKTKQIGFMSPNDAWKAVEKAGTHEWSGNGNGEIDDD